MAGRYPNADGQKVSRGQTLGWVELPARRDGPPPELPDWRPWAAPTHEWWAHLWTRPQAVMWDQSGSSLWVLACLIDDLVRGGEVETAKVAAEMRQHEDRHGLNPKALLQLRWRIPPAESEDTADPGPAEPAADRRSRLKVVA